MHHIALHRTALQCISLHLITSHYIASPHHNTTHRIALHCIASHCIALHRIASHRIASHRIAVHRIALHRSASHRIASHCIAPHFFYKHIFNAVRCIESHRTALLCIIFYTYLKIMYLLLLLHQYAPKRIESPLYQPKSFSFWEGGFVPRNPTKFYTSAKMIICSCQLLAIDF